MIIRQHDRIGLNAGGAPDATDLIDAALTLEQDMELEEGTLIRELTALLRRRQIFEGLRRDHDVRRRRSASTWAG